MLKTRPATTLLFFCFVPVTSNLRCGSVTTSRNCPPIPAFHGFGRVFCGRWRVILLTINKLGQDRPRPTSLTYMTLQQYGGTNRSILHFSTWYFMQCLCSLCCSNFDIPISICALYKCLLACSTSLLPCLSLNVLNSPSTRCFFLPTCNGLEHHSQTSPLCHLSQQHRRYPSAFLWQPSAISMYNCPFLYNKHKAIASSLSISQKLTSFNSLALHCFADLCITVPHIHVF